MIKIYNSLTKQKEEFVPINPGKVKMYVCGITVYDYCHIGHARSALAFDVVARYFRYMGYDVDYVRNITDIDDKIIQRANENHQSCDEVTQKFIVAMLEDEQALKMQSYNQAPRATEYVAEIIKMIGQLIEKNYAYVADNGDVYYSIPAFKSYGKLSKRDLEQLRVGERVAVVSEKHDPLDFVLWKLAKPGEPSWPSPWGAGRPGWHSECSVMSSICLGEQIDIHGGGMDLMFPHHENEIAQAEAILGKPFVNIWMHNGFLMVNDEKMSKSLKNFLTIREVLEKHDPETMRFLYLSAHYRSPLSYSDAQLEQARKTLERFYVAIRNVPKGEPLKNSIYEKEFQDAMNDDFNVPLALSVLHELTTEINQLKAKQDMLSVSYAALLVKLGNVLGVLFESPEQFLQADTTALDTAKIEELIAKRNQARKDKDWPLADQLRLELDAMNIVLEDTVGQTTWRKK